MVTKRATDLKLVGGDLALDLANTLEGAGTPETLVDADELVAWALKAGVIDAPVRRSDRALAAARDLRTAVFAVFHPLATGGEPPREALDALAAAGADAAAHARLRPGSYAYAWDGDDPMRAVWPCATAAVDLLRHGPLDRLKVCDVCPWLFIDASRNHSRRWCSMDECGGRLKMQRYRERRATAGR